MDLLAIRQIHTTSKATVRRNAENFGLVYSREMCINFKLCRVMFEMLLATTLCRFYLQSEVAVKN